MVLHGQIRCCVLKRQRHVIRNGIIVPAAPDGKRRIHVIGGPEATAGDRNRGVSLDAEREHAVRLQSDGKPVGGVGPSHWVFAYAEETLILPAPGTDVV